MQPIRTALRAIEAPNEVANCAEDSKTLEMPMSSLLGVAAGCRRQLLLCSLGHLDETKSGTLLSLVIRREVAKADG